MKQSLFTIACLSTMVAARSGRRQPSDNEAAEFADWAIQMGRSYETTDEYNQRAANWSANDANIKERNA
jgi:hypothetical protein